MLTHHRDPTTWLTPERDGKSRKFIACLCRQFCYVVVHHSKDECLFLLSFRHDRTPDSFLLFTFFWNRSGAGSTWCWRVLCKFFSFLFFVFFFVSAGHLNLLSRLRRCLFRRSWLIRAMSFESPFHQHLIFRKRNYSVDSNSNLMRYVMTLMTF